MAETRFNCGSVSEVGVYSLSEMGPGLRVSEHFTLEEFACSDGSDVVLIHPGLIQLLESIRLEIGGPLYINSAYRSHHHNSIIGGAKTSKHLYGLAADVRSPGIHPNQIAIFAEQLNVGGIGHYENFTHLDVYGVNRRWRKD
jgi:uncharacterized protein YcbK (DUF882 family)